MPFHEWETIVINRVGGPALLGAAVIVSAWLAWPAAPAATPPEQLPPPADAGARFKFVGVASCSSMACHNFNGAKGSARSEYSTWSAFDKHARAYAVLGNQQSERIVKNYFAHKESHPEKISATERDECLKCHATFTDSKMVRGDRFYIGDGVGCESCHGPAENYLTTHYQTGFKQLSVADKARAGLWPTKDLTFRAQLCTTCHVGDTNKEVNHDLIAAGHPRLNFELAGYHGIANKHWSHDDELTRYPDFEARLWFVGQVSTARAAMKLLEARAASGVEGAKNPRPWPEFAEYACFACHKDLQVDSPTQRSGYYTKRHPGTFPFGTWYFAMMPQLAAEFGERSEGLPSELNKVRLAMERPGPNAMDVAGLTRSTNTTLNKVLGKVVSSQPLDAAQIRGYLKTFLTRGVERANTLTWDEATQLYLSLAAFHQALSDLGDPDIRAGKLKPALLAVKERLRGAFKPGYNSPVGFDPLANDKTKTPSLAQLLQAVRDHLGN